jgi:23S rRNA-/tRNA-specific pseudouridylate synthase
MFPFDTESGPRIVLEEDRFLVAYKPPRLHTAPQEGGGDSLAAWIFERRPAARFESPRPGSTAQGSRPSEGGLFHRLDYETSGLVLFALDPEALASLVASQEAGLVEKAYHARASVSLLAQEGARPGRGCPLGLAREAWDSALAAAAGAGDAGVAAFAARPDALAELARLGSGRGISSRFRPFGKGGSRVACLAPEEPGPRGGGRRSHGSPGTVYSTALASMEPLPGAGSCVELVAVIRRGFRHQIRAQLAWLGLPLVGDALYGGLAFPRLCLQAEALTFPHPSDGSPVHVEISGL